MYIAVGVLTLSLYLRHSRSLKSKRHIVKSFKERAAARYNVSVAEVGDADDVKRAELAVVMVSGSEARVREHLEGLHGLLAQYPEAELLEQHLEFLYPGDTPPAYDWLTEA